MYSLFFLRNFSYFYLKIAWARVKQVLRLRRAGGRRQNHPFTRPSSTTPGKPGATVLHFSRRKGRVRLMHQCCRYVLRYFRFLSLRHAFEHFYLSSAFCPAILSSKDYVGVRNLNYLVILGGATGGIFGLKAGSIDRSQRNL